VAQASVHTGHTGIETSDVVVGVSVALLVHVLLAVALWYTPSGSQENRATANPEDGCASVVSPSCVGAKQLKSNAAQPDQDELHTERRCPDPIRRLQRREYEPAPSIAVDILQAQLVAALGVPDGIEPKDVGQQKGVGGASGVKPKPTESFFGDSKLGELIKPEDKGGDARKKKLGEMIGLKDGAKDGQGNVNQTGSVYWREVGQTIKSHFELPPSVPVWERAGLRAKVRITRMTANGSILAWTWEKKSGNDEFDKAVSGLISSYKSGMRSLPTPSSDALQEINSRGGVIELRAGH
jgi:hypothetical protein